MSFFKKIWNVIKPTKTIHQECYQSQFGFLLDHIFYQESEQGLINFLADNADKIDINTLYRRVPPLLQMLLCHQYNSAKILLQYGADPNIMVDGVKSTLTQVIHSNSNMFELLIEHDADINLALIHDGSSLIREAVRSFKVDRILLCIEAGADINSKNKSGQTLLHIMLENVDKDTQWDKLKQVCIVLIEYGVDPTITNNDGRTVLDLIPAYLSDLESLMVNPIKSATKIG